MTVAEAYTYCRGVARREAKNFFWAFRVLPKHKRDAMCAVYAFMRRADDLSDDEQLSIDERRAQLSAWLDDWRRARASESSRDPVFLAMNDVQRTFGVPDALLHELVSGVALDLERSPENQQEVQRYADFDELYRYCYLVASVVGLVTIRIFGYKDGRAAEQLAEETGIAFQLTNILRDVKEDFERKRLYLPTALMAEYGVSVERIDALCAGSPLRENERAMLGAVAKRAENLYRSGRKLLPLIHRDSRAALWVLLSIYHGLLSRIRSKHMDVFCKRASVPASAKLVILARGAGMALWNRAFG